MLVDERFFFNLDKNHCFPVDFIRLRSDLNVVCERKMLITLLKMAERKLKKKNVSYSFVLLIPVFQKQDLNNIK